jgi:hypothetical protein
LKAASIQALAVVTYCSIFGLMSFLTRRILVAGILYTALVEGLLANMPFGIRLATVIYYARLIAYRTIDYVVQHRHSARAEDIAAEVWQLDLASDAGRAEHPDLVTCIATLLVACLLTTFLAAWLCSQREFHVKTPEKG